jgi:hypothetical protein
MVAIPSAQEELESLRRENERLRRERDGAEPPRGGERRSPRAASLGLVETKEKPPREAKAEKGDRGGKPRGREVPEHQRARTESEGQLRKATEKIRWQTNRVNMSSDRSDSEFGASATKVAAPARPGARTPRGNSSSKRRRPEAPTLPLGLIVGVGVALLALVLILFSRSISNMKGDVAQSQAARREADRLAQQAVKRADQLRIAADREVRAIERKQREELRRIEAAARKEAKRLALNQRTSEASRERAKQAARAASERARPVAKAPAPKSGAKPQTNAAPRAAASANRGPPAPGWPGTVLSRGSELRANAFKVVSVTGIRVGALPSAGCSPCQANGTLSDGTPVTLVAPSFTPFVPAKMARAQRVAVKALVQTSGGLRLLVQSAIKD